MMRASTLPNRLPLLLVAVALMALAALLAHDTPPAAQASSHVYVSNLGETPGNRFGTSTYSIAQGFTTGSASGGYTLGSIDLVVEATNITSAQRDTIRAELWSTVASGDDAGKPNSKLYDLTVPAHPIATGTVSFAAPASTTLAASTTYHAVFYTVGTFDMRADITESDDEDSGGAAGWSIANGMHDVNVDEPTSSSTWGTARSYSLRISVNAPELSPTDLSALTAEGSTDGTTFAALTGANALAPAFDADTTAYRATVGNDVTHVKLTPTVAVTGSTVKVGKAGSLTTVTSGSASAAIALAVGDNEITVEVTAADSTTQDYTVTVRRVPSGTVWHATLVPQDLGAGFGIGCHNDQLTVSTQCSTTAVLTDDDYSVGGTDYVQRSAQVGTDILQISTTGGNPNAELKALNFCVGSTPFALSVLSTAAISSGRWTNTGLTWTAGTPVSLSIGTACAQQTTSSNADLSGLTAEGSTDGSTFAALAGADSLAPAFDAATTGYRATVGNATTHVKLTPTVADNGATVKVGKTGTTLTTVTSGSASAAIALDVGDNAITVEVTASDGATTKEYTVTVRRVPSGTEWHATLTPQAYSEGDPATDGFGCQSFADCISHLTSQNAAFTVGATAYEFNLIMDIDQGSFAVSFTVTANSALQALKFCVGANDYAIGSSGIQQSVDVGWAAGVPVSLSIGTACALQTSSSNADLSNLTASSASSATGTFNAVTLSPSTFDAATTAYTATVANDQSHAKVTPTVADTGKATVAWRKGNTGNFTTVTSGSASGAISLDVTANAITVRVTAESGATKNYTVTITRQAQTTTSSNANLSNLTASSNDRSSGVFSDLTLSPAFDKATTTYTATVANTQTHAKVTPTVEDTGKATVAIRRGSTTGPFATVTSGVASVAIALGVGDNIITVRVTAENGATKDYTVPITRQAQTTTTTMALVSNLGQTVDSALIALAAQGFTTGSNAGGYTLSDIQAEIALALSEADRNQVTAQLWSATTAGAPSAKLADLTVPPHPITAGTVSFTAPPNTTLAAGTKYFIVLDSTGGAQSLQVRSTASPDEDPGAAAGWSIEDARYWEQGGTFMQASGSSMMIAVRGQAISTPTVTLTASPNPVDEGSGVTITATLSAAQARRVTIPLTVTGGTAEPGDHGSLASITINAGNTSGATTVTTAQDRDDEHETFTVSLGTLPPGLAAGSPSSVTVTIRDDEAPAAIWEATLTVAELQDPLSIGCNDADSSPGARCSETSRLTDHDFTYNGVTYEVGAVNIARLPSYVGVDLRFRLDRAIPKRLQGSLVLTVDGARFPLAEAPLAPALGNTEASWRNAGLAWSVGDVVQLSLIEAPIDVAYWNPTLRVGEAGGGNLGCRDGSGASCSAESVLTDHDFSYTRVHPDMRDTRTYRVLELYRTSDDDLVLVTSRRLPDDYILTVLDPSDSDTPRRFPLRQARREGNKATWSFNGRAWYPWTHPYTTLELGMERPRGGLTMVYVHYDGITDDQPDGVDGFIHLAAALAAPYGLKVDLPDEFISIDRDYRHNPVTTTHVKLRMYPVNPGSTFRVKQRDFDVEENGVTTTLTFPWVNVDQGELSQAILLDQAELYTFVDIEVTDNIGLNGRNSRTTYLLAIDPPTRTYSLTPGARVTEGQDATLTLTLSEPAPAGGAGFTVSAGYGSASAADVGAVPSPVTVPEGHIAVEISIPTVDDDLREAEESFTVAVAAPGWGVDPEKTGTATVTIEDNDQGPEPRNVQVVPGDGTLTVSWTVAPRDGVADNDIRHALRWSQEPGVWANPKDPKNVGKNDGITVAGGVTSYLITGLKNGVATGVFVRSYTGQFHDEGSPQSSQWVRVKGDHTTPRGDGQQPPATANQSPTVSSTIPDATIVKESGTHQVSLSGVFDDPDNDALTITAASSDNARASVSVASDYSTLTVRAQARGTATITVTASDGNGGTVDDTFTVTVKAAPVLASAIADVTGLEVGSTQDLSLAGVFRDADGDALTITATSSDDGKAIVWVYLGEVTVVAAAVGDVTITVTAEDSDGNTVSDTFDVEVVKKYAGLIAKVKDYRNDPCCAHNKEHTDRWDRALLAFGETVADTTLIKMPADEAQGYADQGWTRWAEVAQALKEIEASAQQATPNRAPTVSSAIADLTIVKESGTHQVSLSGVFRDPDGDSLTITASSSNTAKATVSVASNGSSMTVSAQARGTATITVTADDGRGGTVDDEFTVTVKAAPVVASAISDVSGLEVEGSQDVSLAGVFSDADGDTLTITAASSNNGKATVAVASDGSKLTLTGVAEGTATITVTARDSDGNTVSDTFEVEVVKKYAGLIADMYQWRNDPCCSHNKEHTDRWDRTLKTFGETVADMTLPKMTADEAQGYADRGWERWVPVTKALRELEGG